MPDENRVFDVARPGHSSPDATSKPIIVGHRPTLSDPMVKDNDPSDFGAESSPTQIMVHDDAHSPSPAHDTNAPGIIDTPEEDWKQPQDHEPLTAPEETPAVDPLPPPQEQPFDAPAGSDTPAPAGDSPTDDSSAVPAESYEPLPSEPLARVEGLHVSEPRRKSPIKMIITFILLLLVAGYLVIDSGLIKTSLNLPFHIFKQKAAPVVSTPASAPNQSTATAAVPTGFTEYKLAGTTITFSAPTAWGQPTSTSEPGYSSRSATPTSDGTYAYLVTFATNKDIQVAVTSPKLLPAARATQYYDYLQWCTGTSDAKIYKSLLHFSTNNKIDTPTTATCDQGPLPDATKLDTATIVQLNTKDPVGTALGDVYTKNLNGADLPVFRVKDQAMASSVDIKKLLLTVKE